MEMVHEEGHHAVADWIAKNADFEQSDDVQSSDYDYESSDYESPAYEPRL